jgi:hypothetical protein
MIDLVKRLREGRTDGTQLRWQVTDTHREAANKIESITRERDVAFAERALAREARYAADAEIERLRAIIDAAMQRLNESGTGEMGVVETIHATHDILRQAREQKR